MFKEMSSRILSTTSWSVAVVGAFIGIGTLTLKNGYYRHSDAVGRLDGSYYNISFIS